LKGPRTDDLIIRYYGDVESAYAALKAGEIDIVGYEITSALYEDAITDPTIVLAPVASLNMFQFDINNNYTIPTYPGIRSPTNYQGFRQALAWLTPKDYIVNDICGGFADRIDQPIAGMHKGWGNESMWYPNYPYEYDPATAAAALDATGFTQGTTINPYYDPGFLGSAEYIRVYPTDHSKAGQDLDPLEVCVRTDDIRRLEAGRLLYGNMRKLGIPVNAIEADSASLGNKVWAMDYHIYTGGWNVERFPTYVYNYYHSNFYYQAATNYVTGMNASNQPNYPTLDDYLYNIRQANSFWDSVIACQQAMGLFTELCVTIPLWSTLSFWAYSSDVIGAVDMAGKGFENGYSFMNAYKIDGSPIRYGLANAPQALNIIYSGWHYDYQNLDRIYLYSSTDIPPYDLSEDQAGLIMDWETSTWIDPDNGQTKTRLTKWFREDAYFVEPLTGNQKAQVNTTDYLFSAWYQYAIEDGWHNNKWKEVHHINVVNDFQVEIYFDTLNYWNTYYASGPILPIDVWLQSPLAYQTTESFTEGVDLTTPGIVNLSADPVWIDSVTADSTPLTPFTDYNIVKGQLEIFVDLSPGASLVVDYWQSGDPSGFTPGNLPWQTILEGAGMYYATDFTPGVGGHLTLKANRHFWMETPLLGEIDFTWHWVSGPKPRSGYYQVDIYDKVMIAVAAGTSGTGIPSSHWLPGADVAPPGGIVDALFEILSQTCHDNEKFAETPSLLTLEYTTAVLEPKAEDLRNCQAPRTPETTVFIDPSYKIAYQNHSFAINVSITFAEQIHGYLFTLYHNSSLLQAFNVNEGPFLKNTSLTNFNPTIDNAYNTTHGRIWCLDIQVDRPAPGADGNGTLATVNYNTTENLGVSLLHLEVDLARVSYFPPAKDTVALAVPHTSVDGTVLVTLPGDIDGDRDVDIYDIVRMCNAYGTKKPDPDYDPACDIDGDGDVDIYDIVEAANQYGKSC